MNHMIFISSSLALSTGMIVLLYSVQQARRRRAWDAERRRRLDDAILGPEETCEDEA